MGFQIMGTAHLGQARCICGTHPEGCPLHQHVEIVAQGVISESVTTDLPPLTAEQDAQLRETFGGTC